MARREPRVVAGTVANMAVRCFLMDVSELVSRSFTDEDYEAAKKFFNGCCAYSGQPLEKGRAAKDHAIPINKSSCGLHLPGNVVPSLKSENAAKGDRDFRDYLEDDGKIQKIEEWLAKNEYFKHIELLEAKLGPLQLHCERIHSLAGDLSIRNRAYLASALGVDLDDRTALPITYYTDRECDENTFKKAFLEAGSAWVVVLYGDGSTHWREWRADKLSKDSVISVNLRNWTDFKTANWRNLGIEQVRLVLREPDSTWKNRTKKRDLKTELAGKFAAPQDAAEASLVMSKLVKSEPKLLPKAVSPMAATPKAGEPQLSCDQVAGAVGDDPALQDG